ncbi:MAG: hypothetical protein U0350_34835 [Caldilineaceae bacterium]
MQHDEAQPETTPTDWNGVAGQLFRTEALVYYRQGQAREGDLLRLTPTWTRWTYWLLIIVVIAGLIGAFAGTLDQYASGPAVVQRAVDGAQPPIVLALLPGEQRTRLQVGMPLRLALTGYPTAAAQTLRIETIGDQWLTPADAPPRLRALLANSAPGNAAFVLVRARPSSSTFTVEQQIWPYLDGMQGRVEARVRSERILFALWPTLKTVVEDR